LVSARDGDEIEAAPRTVSCRLVLDVHGEAEAAFQVTPALCSGIVMQEELLVDGSPMMGHRDLLDTHRGRIQLAELARGRRTVEYRGTVSSPRVREPATDKAAEDLDRLVYLRPSRFCPSDRMGGFASSEFGHIVEIGERAAAIATWIYERISYVLGSSNGRESAEDTLLLGRGTCRDFAHLGVALCRGLGIPARVVAVYARALSNGLSRGVRGFSRPAVVGLRSDSPSAPPVPSPYRYGTRRQRHGVFLGVS
jgi:hypothetical protein